MQNTVALIYQTNVWQKTTRTTISMQDSGFINLDVSGSYELLYANLSLWICGALQHNLAESENNY